MVCISKLYQKSLYVLSHVFSSSLGWKIGPLSFFFFFFRWIPTNSKGLKLCAGRRWSGTKPRPDWTWSPQKTTQGVLAVQNKPGAEVVKQFSPATVGVVTPTWDRLKIGFVHYTWRLQLTCDGQVLFLQVNVALDTVVLFFFLVILGTQSLADFHQISPCLKPVSCNVLLSQYDFVIT